MRTRSIILLIAVAVAMTSGPSSEPLFGQTDRSQAATDDRASKARTLVHILDYIAQDYPVAVSEGEVVDEAEYEEMQQFSVMAISLLEELVSDAEIERDDVAIERARGLPALVRGKAAPEEVAAEARAIRESIVRASGIRVSPATPPDLENGRMLFLSQCTSCHGETGAGDGPLAPTLQPSPTNLLNGERISLISPFQAFNTIRLGVEGTSMSSFEKLTEEEVWDLAFYVKSLQATERLAQQNNADFSPDSVWQVLSMDQVAALDDRELKRELVRRGISRPELLVWGLRTTVPGSSVRGSLALAERHLKEAIALYRAGDAVGARRQAIRAYLEGVEPVEPPLRSVDPTLSVVLEERMMEVRQVIEDRDSIDDLAAATKEAIVSIGWAREALDEHRPSPWFAGTMSASILLREGLEAFLIILAILGVVRATGLRKAARWVHGGWMLALAVGIAGWFVSGSLLRIGAAERELMEGAIAILAVFVLLYAGFWLHSKTHIHKWKAFIDGRIKKQLHQGNLFGLAAIAFLAVFREAFESVLFLSALTLESGLESKLAVAGGALAAIVFVIGAAVVVLRFSKRLPVRQLFQYASLMMGILAVILAGKGIQALQEAGLVSITSVSFMPRIDLLGIYPTAEPVVAQIVALCVLVLLWFLPGQIRRQKASPVEAVG